jgi:hypothetical protein
MYVYCALMVEIEDIYNSSEVGVCIIRRQITETSIR